MTSKLRLRLAAISLLLGMTTQLSAQVIPYECFGALADADSPSYSASGPCVPRSPVYTNSFRKKETFMPVNGSYGPLYTYKNIRVAIHVIQPTFASTSLNYAATDEALIRNFMSEANNFLANNAAPSDPITVAGRDPWITDTRFRVSIKSIDYTKVNLTWEDIYGGSPTSFSVLKSAGLIKDYDSVLNVFLVYSSINDIGGGYTSKVVTFEELAAPVDDGAPYIVLKNLYKSVGLRASPTSCASIFLHELGHAFGLNHVYLLDYGREACCEETLDETNADYLEDVFGSTATTKYNYRPYDNGTYPPPPGTLGVAGDDYTNNFMGGAGEYYSPMQLGRMHRNAHLLRCRRWITNFYPEDDDHNHTGDGQTTPFNITGNETWDFDVKMYSDIVVKTGATLTITCKVMMPHYANIIVEKGGRLVVDGGTITSHGTRDFWYGISVYGDASLSQDVAANQGVVTIRNGALITNALHAITAGDDVFKDFSKRGGIIKVDGAHFYNNKVSVAFWSFHNKNTAGVPVPNRSYIRNATFELDDYYNYDGSDNPDLRPLCQISAWDVDGISILGNTLDNKMSLGKRGRIGSDGGNGIMTFEGNFVLSDYKPTLLSPVLPSNVRGFASGVNAEAVVAIPFTVSKTNFIENSIGVNMSGINSAAIHDNQIKVTKDRSSLGAIRVGFQAYGSNAYAVYNNNFYRTETWAEAGKLSNVGTYIIEGGSDKNELRNNTYSGMFIGAWAQGLNTSGDLGSPDINRGLQYRCNSFDAWVYNGFRGSNIDLYTSGSDSLNDGIRVTQGKPTQTIGNVFSNNTYVYYHGGHIVMSNVQPVSGYYYSTLSGSSGQAPTYYTTSKVVPIGLPVPNGCTIPNSEYPPIEIGSGTATSSGVFSTLRFAYDDSTGMRITAVANAYNAMHSAYADAELSLFYIKNGMISQGLGLYGSILGNNPYGLNAKEVHEFTVGQSLVQLLADHYQTGIPMMVLAPTEIAILHNITANSVMWPRAKACSWLRFATGESCGDLPFTMPVDSGDLQRTVAITGTNEQLSISPNPATSGIFRLQYQLEADAQLTISDINGRIITTVNLNYKESNLSIDATQWNSGVYLYQVTRNKATIYNGKLLKY